MSIYLCCLLKHQVHAYAEIWLTPNMPFNLPFPISDGLRLSVSLITWELLLDANLCSIQCSRTCGRQRIMVHIVKTIHGNHSLRHELLEAEQWPQFFPTDWSLNQQYLCSKPLISHNLSLFCTWFVLWTHFQFGDGASLRYAVRQGFPFLVLTRIAIWIVRSVFIYNCAIAVGS